MAIQFKYICVNPFCVIKQISSTGSMNQNTRSISWSENVAPSAQFYKTSWPARFFYSSLRPEGVKTTIIQSKREHRILIYRYSRCFYLFRVILKDENCWISEWCYLLWKILLKSCKVCDSYITVAVNICSFQPFFR